MGILSRFGEIMESNINALLDKAEDPAKMVDQKLREAKDALIDVKKETAGVMAEEERTRREYDKLVSEIERYTGLARKAVAAGNDGDASVFLTKKNELVDQLATAEQLWKSAKMNADQMIQMHNKLAADIQEMESKKNAIKATSSAAKAQEKINQFHDSVGRVGDMQDGFDSMAEKAQRRLDAARAAASLSEEPKDEASELAAKYGSAGSKSVADELAALKAELGKES